MNTSKKFMHCCEVGNMPPCDITQLPQTRWQPAVRLRERRSGVFAARTRKVNTLNQELVQDLGRQWETAMALKKRQRGQLLELVETSRKKQYSPDACHWFVSCLSWFWGTDHQQIPGARLRKTRDCFHQLLLRAATLQHLATRRRTRQNAEMVANCAGSDVQGQQQLRVNVMLEPRQSHDRAKQTALLHRLRFSAS